MPQNWNAAYSDRLEKFAIQNSITQEEKAELVKASPTLRKTVEEVMTLPPWERLFVRSLLQDSQIEHVLRNEAVGSSNIPALPADLIRFIVRLAVSPVASANWSVAFLTLRSCVSVCRTWRHVILSDDGLFIQPLSISVPELTVAQALKHISIGCHSIKTLFIRSPPSVLLSQFNPKDVAWRAADFATFFDAVKTACPNLITLSLANLSQESLTSIAPKLTELCKLDDLTIEAEFDANFEQLRPVLTVVEPKLTSLRILAQGFHLDNAAIEGFNFTGCLKTLQIGLIISENFTQALSASPAASYIESFDFRATALTAKMVDEHLARLPRLTSLGYFELEPPQFVDSIGLLTTLTNLESLTVGWKGEGLYVDISLGSDPALLTSDLFAVSSKLSNLQSLYITGRHICAALDPVPPIKVLQLGGDWSKSLKKLVLSQVGGLDIEILLTAATQLAALEEFHADWVPERTLRGLASGFPNLRRVALPSLPLGQSAKLVVELSGLLHDDFKLYPYLGPLPHALDALGGVVSKKDAKKQAQQAEIMADRIQLPLRGFQLPPGLM